MAAMDLIVALHNHRYRVERPWGEMPEGIDLDVVSQVAVDSDDNVYVAQRVDPPIVVFGPDGNYLRSWGTGVIADAHGIFITHDDMVLVVDRDAHQVLGFTPEGDLQMEIGERHVRVFSNPSIIPAMSRLPETARSTSVTATRTRLSTGSPPMARGLQPGASRVTDPASSRHRTPSG